MVDFWVSHTVKGWNQFETLAVYQPKRVETLKKTMVIISKFNIINNLLLFWKYIVIHNNVNNTNNSKLIMLTIIIWVSQTQMRFQPN